MSNIFNSLALAEPCPLVAVDQVLVDNVGGEIVCSSSLDLNVKEYDFDSCSMRSQIDNGVQLGVVSPVVQRSEQLEKVNSQIDNIVESLNKKQDE